MDGARIRTIVTAEHSTDQLDRCLEAFGAVGRELGLVSA
jgi:7-keto-8-aminopelargonate synthetase-like enzyme